jgi:transcriptional regulator with XRE-family HTH domain
LLIQTRNTERVDGLYKEFGRGLKKARRDADLTQKQVADRVGLSRTSITNIERGNQHIALHHLFLLAAAVGRQPEELLPDDEVALEELLSPKAMRALAEEDEEGRDFAVRVLRKSGAVRQSREGTVSG